MCRRQYVLALIALYMGLANSWDIAVSVGDRLDFFINGVKTDTVHFESHNLTTIVYDEVHNMILYADKQSDYDAICGYDLSNKITRCFVKRYGGDIHGLAFDPVTELLFFTDTNERSINWISLKPGYNNNLNGNLLMKMDDRTPTDIAVDSCKGYIYWTNTNIVNYERMERARLDGSRRKVINNTPLTLLSLAVDSLTQKIYYFDGSSFDNEYFNSGDLNGADLNSNWDLDIEEEVIECFSHPSISKVLTVSKDYMYWMNGSESHKTVWQRPKNANGYEDPEEISTFYTEKPLGIATNYKVEEQIKSLLVCEIQSRLIPTTRLSNNHSNNSLNSQQTKQERCELNACHGYCLNNGTCSLNEASEPVCQCKGNYVGERCEVSRCLNYCIQGNCGFNDEGHPICRCNAGYSGKRCEVYACHGYCLNNGECFLNEENEPICRCVDNHKGARCEAVQNDDLAFTNTTTNVVKRNITIVDLLSSLRKPITKISVTVEVKSN